MSTLLARLAGPGQAWGAEPSLRTATTHPTPTWSGLLGLARAALGHGHGDPQDTIAWLRQMTMAVRIDQPGAVHADYHTINPLPASYEQLDGITPASRGLVPLGTQLRASGQAPRWIVNGKPVTLPTRRHLIYDAASLWLVTGPEQDVQRLAAAVSHPQWALCLGRKSCTPTAPLLLGVHPGPLLDAARSTPHVGTPTPTPAHTATPLDQQVDLVWLTGPPDPALPVTGTRTALDDPAGSHPQNGYRTTQHTLTRLPAPVRQDLLGWAADHLDHPDRPSTRQETP